MLFLKKLFSLYIIKKKKLFAAIDALFFIITSSHVCQTVKYLKGLSLHKDYMRLSMVRGQGKEGNPFFSLLAQTLKCARLNIKQ